LTSAENQWPYDVLLGRLGADRLAQQARDPFTFPKSGEPPGCRFFPETGHNACGDILAAWPANGLEIDGVAGTNEGENLALFGLPLSDVQTEQLEGKDYQVQWFERARFELHPENQPPYNVLLGLLGNEIRADAAPQTIVAPLPQPTQAPTSQPQPTQVPAPVPPPSDDRNTGGADVYNCSVFATWDEAKAVYQANLPGDPNDLDRDNDGIPCESLPGAP
jgi:Excalibur calcium-binding domain